MSTNLCVIGAGRIFQEYHYPALCEIDEFKISCVIDTDENVREKFKNICNCQVYSEWSDDIDENVFFITVPPLIRYNIFCEIKDRAKVIIFEKPVTLTYEDAKKILDEANQLGIKCYVAQTRRFFPNLIALSDFFANSKSDRIEIDVYEGALFNWGTISDYLSDDCQHDYGVFNDVGSHVYDTVIDIIDKISGSEILKIENEELYFEGVKLCNNIQTRQIVKTEKIKFHINVNLSRVFNFSNQLCVSDRRLKLFSRTLLSHDISLVRPTGISKIPILDANEMYSLEDVFFDMWSNLSKSIKNSDICKSKINLNNIIRTMKFMDNIIKNKKIVSNLFNK